MAEVGESQELRPPTADYWYELRDQMSRPPSRPGGLGAGWGPARWADAAACCSAAFLALTGSIVDRAALAGAEAQKSPGAWHSGCPFRSPACGCSPSPTGASTAAATPASSSSTRRGRPLTSVFRRRYGMRFSSSTCRSRGTGRSAHACRPRHHRLLRVPAGRALPCTGAPAPAAGRSTPTARRSTSTRSRTRTSAAA